jgi:hypothetical protein
MDKMDKSPHTPQRYAHTCRPSANRAGATSPIRTPGTGCYRSPSTLTPIWVMTACRRACGGCAVWD